MSTYLDVFKILTIKIRKRTKSFFEVPRMFSNSINLINNHLKLSNHLKETEILPRMVHLSCEFHLDNFVVVSLSHK